MGRLPGLLGSGHHHEVDVELIVPDEGKSLAEGAVSCWTSVYVAGCFQTLFKALADTYDFDLNAPWRGPTRAGQP